MLFNDWHTFEKAVKEKLAETHLPENQLLAYYHENPHFDAFLTTRIISLSSENMLVIEVNTWDKTQSAASYQKLGIMAFPPAISHTSLQLSVERSKELLHQLEIISQKDAWLQERIWLDGVDKELHIFQKESMQKINWNIESTNEELNQFSALMSNIQ